MTPREYQRLAAATDCYPQGPERPFVLALGLASESGEVADLFKKANRDGHPVDPAKLALELGDVLWYVAAIASEAGLDLDSILAGNIEKLRRRKMADLIHGSGSDR